ncbi:hypothetical protein ACFFRR_010933 [Megaselia abdita]
MPCPVLSFYLHNLPLFSLNMILHFHYNSNVEGVGVGYFGHYIMVASSHGIAWHGLVWCGSRKTAAAGGQQSQKCEVEGKFSVIGSVQSFRLFAWFSGWYFTLFCCRL